MTQPTLSTVEGNKIICRFMSESKEPYNGTGDFITYNGIDSEADYFDYTEMKYHTSWDWLMPVVKKILATDTGTLDVYSLYVEDSLRTADITKVWEACLDFLTWYNQNQKA